jgi:hypothetical protein
MKSTMVTLVAPSAPNDSVFGPEAPTIVFVDGARDWVATDSGMYDAFFH